MAKETTERRTFKLPKRERLRRTADFQRVYGVRQVVHDRALVVFYLENGLPYARFGVAVGKKHGSAVRRNRLKRLLREAWRLNPGLFPSGVDYILIPRVGAGFRKTAEVEAALRRVVGRLKKR